jgi:hypothetical protein
MQHRCVIAALVLGLGALLVGVPSAGAGSPDSPDPNDTHCLAEFDLTFSPGLSMSPSSGTFTSHGETGTNVCDGTINGHQVTGVGTRGEDGHYGVDGPNTCADPNGEGDFTFSFTQPTTGGPQHVSGTVKLKYGVLQGDGPLGGTFVGERMYGKFQVTVLEGDCVTAPITRVHLRCDEWVVEPK